MQLEDLVPGVRVSGVLPGYVSIIAVHPYGDSAVEVTYKDGDGEVGQQILYRADEGKLKLAAASGPPFDGDGAVFRLVAEALRIKMAGQHDTMLAVTISDLEPLPHQIKAVYGELLSRVSLRLLLADDPGAGKTIMAGLYIKELEQIDAAFDGAEIVVSGVNSFGVRWAGQRIAELLEPDMLVIAIAKGMAAGEDGDLRILPDVLAEQVPAELRARIPWVAIGGPSIAGEVAARRNTCVLFTGHEQQALDHLAATFRTGWYHVWTSTDLVGVEVCAALKNCYALGVGFAEGVLDRLGQADSPDRNHNYEAALFAQAVAEIGQMVRLLGGRPETPYGLAGVGDMFVTSTGGRNIRVGRLLGGGLRFSEARARMGDITLEGAAAIQVIGGALPKLAARGIIGSEDFPLLRRLHAVVGREQPPQIPWSAFFGGEAGAVAAARELAG